MFMIYAVAINQGEKFRHFLGTEEDEFMAKHRANVATCTFADYAYVKDTAGGTIFFIRSPDYCEAPPVQPPRQPSKPAIPV